VGDPEALATARREVQAVWGEPTAAALQFLAEGMEFRVYVSGDVLFRFPKAATTLATESAFLPLLAPRLPARVPLPRPPFTPLFMAYDLIPGTTGEHLDAAAHPEVAPALGRFLRVLHAFPVAEAEAKGARRETRWLPATYRERVRGQATPAWQARLPAALARACEDFLDAAAPPDPTGPGCLIHGDLEAEHVIVDVEHGTLAGVIDWDDLSIADPARDFAGLWAWGGRRFIDRVLAAYDAPIDMTRLHFMGRCFAVSDWFEADPDDDDFARRQLERAFMEDR
jgi:aminoglycoside phosphotransferase (APT) family kinase protein